MEVLLSVFLQINQFMLDICGLAQTGSILNSNCSEKHGPSFPTAGTNQKENHSPFVGAQHLLICQFCLVQMNSRFGRGGHLEELVLETISSTLTNMSSWAYALIALGFVTWKTTLPRIQWLGKLHKSKRIPKEMLGVTEAIGWDSAHLGQTRLFVPLLALGVLLGCIEAWFWWACGNSKELECVLPLIIFSHFG